MDLVYEVQDLVCMIREISHLMHTIQWNLDLVEKKSIINMVTLPDLICKTSLKTLPWLNSLQKISKNWVLLLHVIFCGVVTGPD